MTQGWKKKSMDQNMCVCRQINVGQIYAHTQTIRITELDEKREHKEIPMEEESIEQTFHTPD